MYFTREAQVAPEEVATTHNGSAASAAVDQSTEYMPGVLQGAASESASGHLDGPFRGVFTGAFGEPPTDTAAGFFSNSTLSLSANHNFRSIALKRAQQSHGNHFIQRALAKRQSNPTQMIQRECACGGTCTACQESLSVPGNQAVEAESASNPLVQAKSTSGSTNTQQANHELTIPGGEGEPLAERSRSVMESHFGRDLGDVRIHTDDSAAASAEAFGANAFTSGRDVYFARGKYAPESLDGQRLLAHELVHTLQQANTPSLTHQSASTSDAFIDPDDSLEQDADRVAEQVVSSAGAACEMGCDSIPVAKRPPEPSYGQRPPIHKLTQQTANSAAAMVQRQGAAGSGSLRSEIEKSMSAPLAEQSAPAPGKYFVTFYGPTGIVMELSDNDAHIKYQLAQLTEKHGLDELIRFFDFGFHGGSWQLGRESEHKYVSAEDRVRRGLPPIREFSDEEKSKGKEITYRANELAREMLLEYLRYLGEFEKQLRANTLSTLQANEEQTKTEMARYGITWRDEPPEVKYSLLGALVGGVGGGISVSVTTHYSMSESAPESRGLQEAAKIALARRLQIEDRRKEQSGEVRSVRVAHMGEHSTELQPTPRYFEIGNQIAEMEKQYEQVLRTLAEPYPVLAYFGALDKSLDTLTAMAQLGPSEGMAKIVGPRIRKQLDNIEKVRDGIKDGDVNFWRLPHIVGITKVQLGVDQDPLRKRLVDDKVEDEQPGPLQSIAIAVLDIVALLLAPVTGGLSLVVAAGINTAVAVKNVQNYLLQKAMANTAFNRAEAISQEEPSLFWVAVDIVAIIPDLGDALRAFRGLSRAIRSARRARLGMEVATEADDVIRAVARQHKLTDEVAESIVRGARDPDFALKELGVAESELEGLRTARKQVEQEAETAAVVAANAAAGGTVKVSPGGLIFSCTSPCTVLREHYAQQLAHAPQEVLDELNRLEAAAATARGNTHAMQQVADQAAALEARIRNVPVATWRSPAAESPRFNDMVSRRGSAAPELDRHPPGWSGADEAHFRYGAKAKPEEGYSWVLGPDGTLRYRRTSRELPVKRFDPDTGTFHVVPERQAATQLESAEELGRLAEAGKAATDRSKWLSALRRIPGLDHLSDEALERVLKLSPNVDHMKGQLLEELVGPTLKTEARRLTREQPHYFEFIRGDRIRDAAGQQLTDGMILRRRRDGIYEVVAFGEAKAGEASSRGLRASRKSYSELTEAELQELQREAVSEIRVRAGYDIDYVGHMPGLSTDELLRTRGDEIKAIMRDLHGQDMGQIRKGFERLMPGADETTVTILIDGKPTRVLASSKTTRAIGIAPSDVSIQQTIQNLMDQGLQLEAHEIGITAQELEALARQLRAEALTNGSRFPPAS